MTVGNGVLTALNIRRIDVTNCRKWRSIFVDQIPPIVMKIRSPFPRDNVIKTLVRKATDIWQHDLFSKKSWQSDRPMWMGRKVFYADAKAQSTPKMIVLASMLGVGEPARYSVVTANFAHKRVDRQGLITNEWTGHSGSNLQIYHNHKRVIPVSKVTSYCFDKAETRIPTSP